MPVTDDVLPDSARKLITDLQARIADLQQERDRLQGLIDAAEREAAELRELLSGELAELRAAVTVARRLGGRSAEQGIASQSGHRRGRAVAGTLALSAAVRPVKR